MRRAARCAAGTLAELVGAVPAGSLGSNRPPTSRCAEVAARKSFVQDVGVSSGCPSRSVASIVNMDAGEGGKRNMHDVHTSVKPEGSQEKLGACSSV